MIRVIQSSLAGGGITTATITRKISNNKAEAIITDSSNRRNGVTLLVVESGRMWEEVAVLDTGQIEEFSQKNFENEKFEMSQQARDCVWRHLQSLGHSQLVDKAHSLTGRSRDVLSAMSTGDLADSIVNNMPMTEILRMFNSQGLGLSNSNTNTVLENPGEALEFGNTIQVALKDGTMVNGTVLDKYTTDGGWEAEVLLDDGSQVVAWLDGRFGTWVCKRINSLANNNSIVKNRMELGTAMIKRTGQPPVSGELVRTFVGPDGEDLGHAQVGFAKYTVERNEGTGYWDVIGTGWKNPGHFFFG